MLVFLALFGVVAGGMINLDPNNVDQTLKDNPLVMINFSAGWCRYSQALKPIYEKAADALANTPGVKLAYADCVAHNDICTKYRVSKYPTMKFVRSGELMKSEYRGQRSVEAITEHINKLMEDPVKQLHGDEELKTLKSETKSKFVLGYFASTSSYGYEVFKSSAQAMLGQCHFYAMTGDDAKPKIASFGGQERVYLVNDVDGDKVYEGSATNQPQLSTWVKENCVPLVREITFENGEELTEEGLPFVILFHDPEDQQSVKLFTEKVAEQCQDQRSGVNFLHADGFKFAHPLSHLGRTTKDLPVIAIDSFKHMYLFPKFENIKKPNRLRRFIEDLHSGRLHREFHGEVFKDRSEFLGYYDSPRSSQTIQSHNLNLIYALHIFCHFTVNS
jgi:endoplasmic reticulum resident protein 44